MNRELDPSAQPGVALSVVVPTYNRAGPLAACLAALSRQTAPLDAFEVVVVVDGSTDGTRGLLADRASTFPVPLRVLWQPNRGQAAALNAGIEAAAGEVCLFLDDDIVAEAGLVAAHLRAQQAHAPGGAVALGHLTLGLPPRPGWTVRQFAAAWEAHYERLGRGERPLTFMDCWSGNLSVPRAALQRLGGFARDLRRNFDQELGYRLEGLGLPLVYVPDATGRQEHRKDWRQVAADAEAAGAANVDLYRRHPAMLPRLWLGRPGEPRPRFLLARRLLLASRAPVGAVVALGPVVEATAGGRGAHAWYGLFFDYCYWRGVQSAVADRGQFERLLGGTPILMYHAVGRPGELPSRFVVPVGQFARQMAWLRRRGYRVLGLSEWLQLRRAYRLPPARSVIVTLDDGYADTRTLAFPVLRRYALPATVFLVSGRIGGTNDWDHATELAGRELLTWSAVREMAAHGISYGAHTRTHPRLTDVSAERAAQEVRGSRLDLEEALGVSVRAFAYPYGKADSAIRALAAKAGFEGACGIQPGLNDAGTPLYALRRTEIYGTDSLFRFAFAVWLGHARRAPRAPSRRRVG